MIWKVGRSPGLLFFLALAAKRSGPPDVFPFHALTMPQRPLQEEIFLQVIVRDNNVEQALRVLKKKMQREGVFREMRARSAYEKPSEKRAREKADAIRRSRKLARKKMQREGLLPSPKPKVARGR